MKYATKNSDSGNVSISQDRRYCGKPIGKDNDLRSFFFKHILYQVVSALLLLLGMEHMEFRQQ